MSSPLSRADEGLLDADPMDGADATGHELDDADRAASDAGPMSGAEQQWKKTRLIAMMEEVSNAVCSQFSPAC